MMQLQAWVTIGKNPSVDPPVTVSIAPVTRTTGIFPWLLPRDTARELLGEAVDSLTEAPQLITLTMAIRSDHA